MEDAAIMIFKHRVVRLQALLDHPDQLPFPRGPARNDHLRVRLPDISNMTKRPDRRTIPRDDGDTSSDWAISQRIWLTVHKELEARVTTRGSVSDLGFNPDMNPAMLGSTLASGKLRLSLAIMFDSSREKS